MLKNRVIIAFYTLMAVSLAAASLFTVSQATHLAFHGQTIKSLETEQTQLKNKLSELTAEYHSQTSLATVTEIAHNQGYQPLVVTSSLVSSQTVATR
ncbi:MAG TPA: hypothetical protein VD999_05535 [Vitreimonas sp.]|nr:hypothetical protein [Vitreimonas sp.]